MKKFLLVVLLIGAAYVAGYWPQRGLREQLISAKSTVQAGKLHNELMDVLDQIQNKNFGTAQQIAGQFFNDLHNQMDDPALAPYRSNLQPIADSHDAVIAALAKGDGSISGNLWQDVGQIRQIEEKLASQTNF
ncbi:MAG TPA: hypothetical protein VGF44_07485 [Terriglobales bacterium]